MILSFHLEALANQYILLEYVCRAGQLCFYGPHTEQVHRMRRISALHGQRRFRFLWCLRLSPGSVRSEHTVRY